MQAQQQLDTLTNLAKSYRVKIRFFVSKFEDLPQTANRKYDCVFSNYFDKLPSKKMFLKFAKGIYQVLKEDGKFIFCSSSPGMDKRALKCIKEKKPNLF